MKTPSVGHWALGHLILSLDLGSLWTPSMWRGDTGLHYAGALLCIMSKQAEKSWDFAGNTPQTLLKQVQAPGSCILAPQRQGLWQKALCSL